MTYITHCLQSTGSRFHLRRIRQKLSNFCGIWMGILDGVSKMPGLAWVIHYLNWFSFYIIVKRRIVLTLQVSYAFCKSLLTSLAFLVSPATCLIVSGCLGTWAGGNKSWIVWPLVVDHNLAFWVCGFEFINYKSHGDGLYICNAFWDLFPFKSDRSNHSSKILLISLLI